jgi:hypothetical protein
LELSRLGGRVGVAGIVPAFDEGEDGDASFSDYQPSPNRLCVEKLNQENQERLSGFGISRHIV